MLSPERRGAEPGGLLLRPDDNLPPTRVEAREERASTPPSRNADVWNGASPTEVEFRRRHAHVPLERNDQLCPDRTAVQACTLAQLLVERLWDVPDVQRRHDDLMLALCNQGGNR